MTVPRIYLPRFLRESSGIVVEGDEYEYLARAVRARRGDEFVVYGWGREEARARIEEIGRGFVKATVTGIFPVPEPRVKLTLFQAVLKEDGMDEAIRGAAVLGVHSLQPVVCEHSIPVLNEIGRAKKVERWQKIAIRASSLARVAMPMKVAPVLDFTAVVGSRASAVSSHSWILCEQEQVRSLVDDLRKEEEAGDSEIAVFVGPEGGFTAAEVESARNNGWTPVGLGWRILPASLAGLVACTLILGFLGDLATEAGKRGQAPQDRSQSPFPLPTEEGKREKRQSAPSA